MGEYDIVISDMAKQDIRDTAAYIRCELQEPAVAQQTSEAILDAILTLEWMPARASLVRDKRLAGQHIRRLIVKNYSVFFRINEAEQSVEIVRILYSRRDWSSIL